MIIKVYVNFNGMYAIIVPFKIFTCISSIFFRLRSILLLNGEFISD